MGACTIAGTPREAPPPAPSHRARTATRTLATRPGSRVELRDLVLSDREPFLEMVRDSRDLHRPWTYPPERADQFDDLVSRTVRDDFACLAAVLAANGELVGIFTVSQIVRGYFQSAYLGYYANARHAGKGLMSESMALVLDHAFGPLSLHRLEANIQPGNAPVDRAGPRRGLPAGGLLAALPADRRPLARPRALRDHGRRARAEPRASLGTVLVAVGLTAASGADFTAQSANPANTFSAGTLTMSNSASNAAILTAAGMRPGDAASEGTVDIANTGSLSGAFTLTRGTPADSDSANPLSGKLNVVVDDCGTFVRLDRPDLRRRRRRQQVHRHARPDGHHGPHGLALARSRRT